MFRDRYCINCICVVLISLHFINLIKISSVFGAVAVCCGQSSMSTLHAKWVFVSFLPFAVSPCPPCKLLFQQQQHQQQAKQCSSVWCAEETTNSLKTRIVQSIASCLSSSEAFRVSKCCRKVASMPRIRLQPKTGELVWVDGLKECKIKKVTCETARKNLIYWSMADRFLQFRFPFLIIIVWWHSLDLQHGFH